MSAAFVPFLYELRAKKVKVGAQEAVALAKALAMGLHDSSLDGFYHVARAICVHRESDLDAFDEAFDGMHAGHRLAIAASAAFTRSRPISPAHLS